ncbi:MAG: imelysin family protein [Polyangiaceae bacterium]
MIRSSLLASLCLAAALGCSSTDDEPTFDRNVAVASIVDDVILPTVTEAEAKAEALRVAAEALEAAPDQASLDAAQQAWRDARAPWRRSDAFRYGPVVDLGLVGAIDWSPTNPETIEEIAAGTAALDAAAVDGLGSSAKGFMALEYLLFDNSGDAPILAQLTDPTSGARRRLYLRLLADNLHQKLLQVSDAWARDKGNYAGALAEPGESSPVYPTTKKAVDEIVNQLVFQAEVVANAKIGKPFGKQSGGELVPAAEESWRSDNSLADIESTWRGIEDVYQGRSEGQDGAGISDMVAFKSKDVDSAARAAFAAAFAAAAAIPPPLRLAFSANPAEVDAAWNRGKELKRVLATDVVGVLGVTLSFSDNDGD